jgi:micrococcal nuclease
MRKCAALIVALVGLAFAAAPYVRAVAGPSRGKVVDVYDGDTITVEAAGASYKVRLLGIDAPEMNYNTLWSEMEKVEKFSSFSSRGELHEARAKFERSARLVRAYARASRARLVELVRGKDVRLVYDKRETKDRYGRILAYVEVGGTDVSAEMLRSGWAVADTRFSCERLAGYVTLWRSAQAAREGVWVSAGGATTSVTPGPSRDSVRRPPATAETFRGSRASSVFHYAHCRSVKQIKASNMVTYASAATARRAGKRPCKLCRPPGEGEAT